MFGSIIVSLMPIAGYGATNPQTFTEPSPNRLCNVGLGLVIQLESLLETKLLHTD